MKLEIGTILRNGSKPYKVEAVLGSGGFGITYKVSTTIKIGNDVMTQNFAMKEHFVKKHCERDNTGAVTCSGPSRDIVETTKADFKAEAQRLINLKHQHIVKVIEQFEENNTVYYVMDYLNGENLRDYVLSHKHLNEVETFDMLLPICDAIRAIHLCKTTHLDIKPANMMLKRLKSGNIIPVLIDFGLAKHYDKNGNATSTMRTQGCSDGYAPIEQYAGIDTFSPQADIYALAASFLFCLTGKRPPIATELEDAVTIAKLLPQRIHVNVRSAIVHAMLPSRKQRTKSVDELEKELRQGCKEYMQVCQENFLDPNEDKPQMESPKTEKPKEMQPVTPAVSNTPPTPQSIKNVPVDNSNSNSNSNSGQRKHNSTLPPVKNDSSSSKPIATPPPINEVSNSHSNPRPSTSEQSRPPMFNKGDSYSNSKETISRPSSVSRPIVPPKIGNDDSNSNSFERKQRNINGGISTIPTDKRDIHSFHDGGFKKKNNNGLKTFFVVLLVLALIAGIVWGILVYEPADGNVIDSSYTGETVVEEATVYDVADSVAVDSVM